MAQPTSANHASLSQPLTDQPAQRETPRHTLFSTPQPRRVTAAKALAITAGVFVVGFAASLAGLVFGPKDEASQTASKAATATTIALAVVCFIAAACLARTPAARQAGEEELAGVQPER